jgi:hypothetical protein
VVVLTEWALSDSSMTVDRSKMPLPTAFATNAQRDAAIVRRYQGGESLAGIGATIGLSRAHVQQIVRGSGARMRWEYKCAVVDCLAAPRSPNRCCHTHLRRIKLYGDPVGSKPLLRERHGTRACYQEGGCRCDLCRKAVAERRRAYDHRRHPEMRRYGVKTDQVFLAFLSYGWIIDVGCSYRPQAGEECSAGGFLPLVS